MLGEVLVDIGTAANSVFADIDMSAIAVIAEAYSQLEEIRNHANTSGATDNNTENPSKNNAGHCLPS